MKSQNSKIGVFIAIIGIASIIISQSADFRYTKKIWHDYPASPGGYYGELHRYNTPLKNGLLYGGIAFLVLGAGVATFSATKQN